jgi:hypothetical protein
MLSGTPQAQDGTVLERERERGEMEKRECGNMFI